LDGALGKIDALSQETGRRAGFESFNLEPEPFQGIGEIAGPIAHSTALRIFHSDVHERAEESARGDDDRLASVGNAHRGHDSGHGVTVQDKIDQTPLLQIEVWLPFADRFHSKLVRFFVGLGAGSADGGTFSRIQHSELNSGGVGVESHLATERVNFPDEMAFGQAADGRVAAHLGDRVEVHRQKKGLAAHPSGSEGGFATRVPGADHNHIVGFWINEHRGVT
jgi:hypothetical protein